MYQKAQRMTDISKDLANLSNNANVNKPTEQDYWKNLT